MSQTGCPNCDRTYDLPTEPGIYRCTVCGREYQISANIAPVILDTSFQSAYDIEQSADLPHSPQVTHHCPGCERLRAELLACCELHERSMMIIEEALGPDRPNGGTWRAQQIANEIIALRNFIAMDKEATTGERIRQMRLARGMTQDQLSSAAGISKGFLSDVENGKRDISSRNLLRIATALSASVDYLLQGVFCPDCEAAARQLADLRARLDKLADRWDTESVAEYKQCASELEALLAETEAK